MHTKHGFTLIELLAVVVILGILTSIALPQYRKSIQRAEAANALINVRAMFDAAKRYYATSSTWPTSITNLDVEFLDIATVDHDGEDAFNMGEFQYSLINTNTLKGVAACRIANGETDGNYCLVAYYRLNGVRDVYECNYQNSKYRSLCESLGTCPPVGSTGANECTIE